jgi:hypothetical protein
MKRILDSERETRRAVEQFRGRIRELAGQAESMEWGFPDGNRAFNPTYTLNSKLGPIHIGVPESWNTRIPHLLRFPKENGLPSPDVEVNIPKALNRSVSGVYVAAGDSLWLCTRGAFNAFRGAIPREITFAHFREWLVDVRDGDRQAQVIPVAALGSNSLADELAEFMQAVIDLKTQHKRGETTAPLSAPAGTKAKNLKA